MPTKATAKKTTAISDPVGMGEIAHRAGVTVDAVKQWRKRHDSFPAPVITLAVGPLWSWKQVDKWLQKHRPELRR